MHSYVFPGDLDKEIAAIGSQPIPYMRTDGFSKINLENESILLDLIHCQGGKVIVYTGSGTGAMSAVVENYVSTKKKAIAVNGGSFGKRWVSLCGYYGIPVIDFKVPFAKDIDYDELDAFFSVNKKLADKYGMQCWTNAESFDRDMPIRFLPIKFDKLRMKLEAAKRCGYDKAITFEFSHFMSPQSAYLQAGHLYDRYMEYFDIR